MASGHYYTVQERAVLTVDGPGGVLSNSADPDDDWLTAKIDTNPTNGTLSLSSDGSSVYTPNPLFNGDDSFTYKVTDTVLDSNVATVHIRVSFVNQLPVANDDGYSVAQDTVLQIVTPGVLANDSDPEQHVLGNAQVVTLPSHGTAALGVLGSLVYSPAPGFSGTDTFTYKMTDGDLESNVATVTITVNAANRAPVANDDSYSVAQDGGLLVPYPVGERMSQVFVELLGRGYRQVILIGSDLPALPPDFFHRAFMQLAATTNHVVLGPSQDGGYYLVGMNRLTPQIFRSMTWSHDQVLRQTTAKLAALGVDFSYLPAWFDVDTVKDIERVRSLGDPAIRNAMKRTLSCLEALEL